MWPPPCEAQQGQHAEFIYHAVGVSKCTAVLTALKQAATDAGHGAPLAAAAWEVATAVARELAVLDPKRGGSLLAVTDLIAATACGGRIVQLEEDKALREYDREAISEAAKFERDTTGVGSLVGELNDRTGQAAQQTVVIVTALGCVALDGGGASSEGDVGGNLPRLRGGLELLASAARRPGAVLAFEALWVPDEDDEVLDGEELTLTWPEIISC